ncbi:MAG TPA: alpha/beta fold hydrolase [Actinomycetota bacterium]|nr:alpha/beta fold hydrolase [Actinomycetota bacterium]
MRWQKASHRKGATDRTARILRIGSSTGGLDHSGETQRSAVPLAVLLGLALAATLLVGCSGDRPPGGDVETVQIPSTPVGSQLEWVMAQLNGGADTLTEEDVVAHFAPEFLQGFPPQPLIEQFRRTSAQAGHITLTGFSVPLSSTEAIGLITSQRPVEGSERAAAYMNVEVAAPHRITYLNLGDLPGPSAQELATPGPYTGAFDVGGGRTLFLTCSGSASPTVILEAGAGGGANAWTKVQPEVANLARVCSCDRANIPGGASDPAPKPRTAEDVVEDLHAALTAAGVPGPFVLVGHSDGGLFVRLYASRYPDEVVGMVLVDAVSEELDASGLVLLKELLSQDQWRGYQAGLEQQARAPFVARVDDEQVDIAASSAEMRATLADSPLRPMPLFVLTHGVPDPPSPGEPLEFAQAKERVWQELQQQLARLVPNAKHLVVRDSGHIIQEEQPDVVIDAIRRVVEAVRDPGTW